MLFVDASDDVVKGLLQGILQGLLEISTWDPKS